MITIRDYTRKPLTHVGGIAAYCYGMEDKTARFKKIAQRCLSEEHGRVSEFATIEMEIDGYSAKVIRELYTHIIGTSRLQASTRYIDYTKQFNYVTPKSIIGKESEKDWHKAMKTIMDTMNTLKEDGVPVEDFSNLLPLAYETKMVLKINVRALIHMFGVRSCTCAYHEYRDLMKEMKKAIIALGDEEWNFLASNYFVPKCVLAGYCNEETRHCGIREKKSVLDTKLSLVNGFTTDELNNILADYLNK